MFRIYRENEDGIIVYWYDKCGKKLHTGTAYDSVDENGRTIAKIYEDHKKTKLANVDSDDCYPFKWVAVFMFNVGWIMRGNIMFIIFGLLWMGLEYIIYGEVQNRLVDNLLALPLFIIFCLMFKFKEERDKLKKYSR